MLYVNPLAGAPAQNIEQFADNPAREKQALQEFERFFLYQLVKEMRRTVPESELWGNGPAQQTYREWMDDALAGALAQSGQFGVAEQISKQWEAQAAAIKSRLAPADNLGVPEATVATAVQTPTGVNRWTF